MLISVACGLPDRRQTWATYRDFSLLVCRLELLGFDFTMRQEEYYVPAIDEWGKAVYLLQ